MKHHHHQPGSPPTNKQQMSSKASSLQSKSTKLVLIAVMSLVLLTTVPLYYPAANSSAERESEREEEESPPVRSSSTHKCDIFTGEWVRNPEAPYYRNTTCWAIHEHQNCIKYGRPDTDFMKWRWQPDGCDLPVLNPAQFLEMVRDKSLAFVGDSVSRNQMQSLICLLSRVITLFNINRI